MLELEQERIRDFVFSEEARLKPDLLRLKTERASSRNFVLLADSFFSVMRTSLRTRLSSTVSEVVDFGADLASERLNEVFTGLRAAIGLFASITASQSQIPAELYGVTSWFFDRCSRVCAAPPFILSIDDSFYTEELRQFLGRFFIRPINRPLFPELTSKFEKHPFFFIFLPASAATLSGSLDWPLIFHECVHALEEQVNYVGKFFQGLPRSWTELDALAKSDEEAQKAQQTLEMICDYLATRIAGPVFAWRFLKRFFSLSGIFHQPSSHPNADVRVHRLIELLKTNGFVKDAQAAQALLTEILQDLGNTAPPESVPVPSELTKAEAEYAAHLGAFDVAHFDKSLGSCGTSRKRALSDIIAKRPAILDPASLFTVVAFSKECETDPKIPPMLADFLRLDRIRTEFRDFGFHD